MKTQVPSTIQAAETKVANLISGALEAKAIRELEACLDSEIYVRAARGPGGIDYKAVPDRAIRLAAAVKIIEFSRGKPATSLTVTTVPPGNQRPASPADLAALIAKNPEVAARVMDAIVANARSVAPTAAVE